MNINDLRQRVNDKRAAIELPRLTKQQFLRAVCVMQNKGQLKIENGDVVAVIQYPTMIYRSPK